MYKRQLLPRLLNPTLQIVLVAIGVVVLFPMGVYFLALAVKNPRLAYNSARHRWSEGSIPERLTLEAAKAAALTVFNPLSMLYWAGVTSSWLPFAYSVLGKRAPGWGTLMAGAGLMLWFTALTAIVRFIPHRIDAIFFRLANAILEMCIRDRDSRCSRVAQA